MSETKTTNYGISLGGLLTVAFVVLKLCKVISWSWWWVLSPILIPIGIGLICILIAIIGEAIENYKDNK